MKFTKILGKYKGLQNLALIPLFIGLIAAGCSKKGNDKPNEGSGQDSSATSRTGDVVGKLVVGYQGWFACAGDGSPRNTWVHWGGGAAGPGPNNQTFELWPDMREYTQSYQTNYSNLGNGQPAKLFSSWSDQVVNKHFEWMQHYGIDCAALQRFGSELGNSPGKAQRDGVAVKVKNAAEAYSRKFYIMYDISGWNNFQTEIKADWTNTIKGALNLISSGAYAKQDGKPVVCIWGIGVSGRPGTVASWTDVINWFKNQGCYVIIGVHRQWRSDADLTAYNAADMINPWCVGSYKNISEVNAAKRGFIDDLAYLKARGKDFQPVCFPGFAWSNWNGGDRNAIPRIHGDFMWQQFYNFKTIGVNSLYVAMFDEFDEGTAICKAAENSSMVPTNQYFLTLDADGVAVSSDFYLRLVGDGAKMLKGQIGLTADHPTSHMP